MNKLVKAAIAFRLRLYWRNDLYHGLSLYALTRLSETGLHRSRLVYSTREIKNALQLAIDIYKQDGNQASQELTGETFWQYGFEVGMVPLIEELRLIRGQKGEGGQISNFEGYAEWRKQNGL